MSSNEMTVEQARAKLGDLVIKAMQGESTIITRYGKPVAQIVPFADQEPAMPVTLEDLRDRITASITANGDEFAKGIDVDAVAEEIRDTYGSVAIDDIDADEYWAIVAKQDATQ